MSTLANHVIAQTILPRTSGLSEDVITNTWHFRRNPGVSYDDAATAIGAILPNFFNSLTSPATTFPISTFINDQVSRTSNACLTKVYDGSIAPTSRVPTTTTWTMGAVGNTTSYPAEVAVCLSFFGSALLYPLVPAARRRGRVFVGPLNSDAVGAESAGDPRPDSTFISRLLDSAERLKDQAQSNDVQWCVWSRTNNVLYSIDTAYVDNAFDTQRRRGAAPTARTSRSL